MRPRTCMADADRLRALGCPTARSAGADPTPEPGRSTVRSALQVLGRISGRPPKVRDRIADRRPGQRAPEDTLRPRGWREAETAPGVQRSGPSSMATPMVSSRRPESGRDLSDGCPEGVGVAGRGRSIAADLADELAGGGLQFASRRGCFRATQGLDASAHTWASSMLAAGHSEGDVMQPGGWTDRSTLSRYGASAAAERARAAYCSPIDRLARGQ